MLEHNYQLFSIVKKERFNVIKVKVILVNVVLVNVVLVNVIMVNVILVMISRLMISRLIYHSVNVIKVTQIDQLVSLYE